MQTIVERDEPGEIPEKKVQQDRGKFFFYSKNKNLSGDFLQKVIDAGKLQGRIHLNYTDRNLR